MRHFHFFLPLFSFQPRAFFNHDAAALGKRILGGTKVAAATLIGIVLLVGVEGTHAEEPDLDDPNAREKLLKEAVLRNTLEEREEEGAKLLYAENSEIPFTGWSKRIHPNGKVKTLGRCKEGKPDGPFVEWHDNGQKAVEVTSEDGKLEGVMTTWNEKGEKIGEVTFKDGEIEQP